MNLTPSDSIEVEGHNVAPPSSPTEDKQQSMMIAGATNPNDNYEMTTLPQTNIEEEPTRARSKLRLIAVLAGIYLSLFIAALDQTIIATAIPTICSELHSASGYTWILGAYLLANAAAAPIWAKISDIWGRKPILLCAVVFFALSSMFCALSTSMGMLIAARVLQGTAAGGLTQLVIITISDLFSLRKRTLYLGLMEFMWAVAAGVGPVLGGTFTQLLSWRWSFWINLPISGTTFFLLFFFLDVHNPRTKAWDGLKAIDWFGSVSILGLTIMLLLGLNFGGTTFAWDSPKVICLIIFGTLMSLLFIWSEKHLAQYPLMPLGLFTRVSTASSLLVCFVHGFVFIAPEYYLPLYFQSVKSAGPLRSGVLSLPLIVTEAAMGIISGIIINRTGRCRELIWAGVIMLTIGNGLFIHFNATTSIAELVILQIITGIGPGLLFQPPLIALQAEVSQDDTATATATYGFVRELAQCCSIVVGGAVFQMGWIFEPRHRAASNVFLVESIDDPAQRMAVKEAFAWSLRNLWILSTCLASLGIIASIFITKQTLSKEHTETKTGIKKKLPSGPGS